MVHDDANPWTGRGLATRMEAQRSADTHNITVHQVSPEDDSDLAPAELSLAEPVDVPLARDLLRLSAAVLGDSWCLDTWPAARAFIARTLPVDSSASQER